MRLGRSAMNKVWRDLQKARETYRYRRYFQSQMSPRQLGDLLIGTTYIQGNAKRRAGRQRIGKFRLWQIRSGLASALRGRGHDVPAALVAEHVPYPFRFGRLFVWQRALTDASAR